MGKELRRSLKDIAHMVRNYPYPGELPEELENLHYYILDGGHCIVVIPEVFRDKAVARGCWRYEVPIPVKYVLAKGWKRIEGTDSVSCDVPYGEFGAEVPAEYDEF